MVDEIQELVNKYRGKEQLVALKCLNIAKNYKVIDREAFLEKVQEASYFHLDRVISLSKLIKILDEEEGNETD